MSVLKLRRDMVVVDDEEAAKPAAADSERPFPLRKLDPEPEAEDIIEGEIADEADEDEHDVPARKTLGQRIKFWFNATAIVALLAAYPTMVIASSDVGDRDFDKLVNRADWAAPWVGGVSTLMQDHFVERGWAPDAAAWEPMARLTAKPAYQSSMAQALGDVIRLASTQATTGGQPDVDLAAARGSLPKIQPPSSCGPRAMRWSTMTAASAAAMSQPISPPHRWPSSSR